MDLPVFRVDFTNPGDPEFARFDGNAARLLEQCARPWTRTIVELMPLSTA